MALWISYVKAWIEEQVGQDMAEYALLVALIALIVVAALGPAAEAISSVFGWIATNLGGYLPSG